MPAHSRAFDLFTTMDTSEANDAEERFFVPSYLRNSKYIQSLSAAHRTRQLAQREPKRPSQDDGLKAVGESVKQTLPQGSHRGMSHAVVERSMSGSEEADESLSPLPSRWNSSDIWGGIEAQQGGMNVKFTGPRTTHEREHEASAVRANNHMPHQCGIYYYEIQILSGKKDECVNPVSAVGPPWYIVADFRQYYDCPWLCFQNSVTSSADRVGARILGISWR